MVAFIILLGIVFGGVKLLSIANNISDSEAFDSKALKKARDIYSKRANEVAKKYCSYCV